MDTSDGAQTGPEVADDDTYGPYFDLVSLEMSGRFEEEEGRGRRVLIELDSGVLGPSMKALDDAVADFIRPPGTEPMYSLSKTEHTTSWGADASALEYVVTVAQSVIDAAIGYGVAKFLERMGGAPQISVVEEEAIERGRLRLATAYELDADALEVVGVGRSKTNTTVTFRTSDRRYTAVVSESRGTASVVEMAWEILTE